MYYAHNFQFYFGTPPQKAEMKPSFFVRPHYRLRDGRSYRPHVQSASYTPQEVSIAYGLPGHLDGEGVTIGIIELGGAFSSVDYAAYMKNIGVTNYFTPVCVGTQQDDPGGANVEVMLDACVIGGIAPRAKQRIYFFPNTGTGIADAINQAVADGCNVISLSWGADEKSWAVADRTATDTALQNAAKKNIPVYVAAGDNGSSDGDTGNNVDYPASSPHAIGCGGTTLVIQNGRIASETVWNDGSQGGATGGGQSDVYPKPPYQVALVSSKTRGVPDVAGVADPATGWKIRAGGQDMVVGGTSAVAPMWAAIHALLIQNNQGKTFDWPNRIFYKNEQCFNDITQGNNGTYQASSGYDCCTGLGSPNGAKLFALNLGGTQPPPPPPAPAPSPPPPPPVCWTRFEKSLDLKPGQLGKVLRKLVELVDV